MEARVHHFDVAVEGERKLGIGHPEAVARSDFAREVFADRVEAGPVVVGNRLEEVEVGNAHDAQRRMLEGPAVREDECQHDDGAEPLRGQEAAEVRRGQQEYRGDDGDEIAEEAEWTGGVDDQADKTVATLTFVGVSKNSRFDQGEPFSESWRMERAQGENQPWLVAGIRQNA